MDNVWISIIRVLVQNQMIRPFEACIRQHKATN